MNFGELSYLLLNMYNIKIWRDLFKGEFEKYFNELNHIYLKTVIFTILTEMKEEWSNKVDYKNLIKILNGILLAKSIFKDENISVKTKPENKITFILNELKKKFHLTEKEKECIYTYYGLKKTQDNKFKKVQNAELERKIWNLASKIVNYFEINLIKNKYGGENGLLLNVKEKEIEAISEKFEKDLKKENLDIKDFTEIFKYFFNSISQYRWNGMYQTNYLNVGAHQLIVTVLFFKYKEKKGIKLENLNNFYVKYMFLNLLYHDIPEVLTKDIISPVKKKIKGYEKNLAFIEKEGMEKVFYPILPKQLKNLLKNVIDILHPFEKKEIKSEVASQKIMINGVEGKITDNISAFAEALYQMIMGNQNAETYEAIKSIMNDYFVNKKFPKQLSEDFADLVLSVTTIFQNKTISNELKQFIKVNIIEETKKKLPNKQVLKKRNSGTITFG